MIIFEKLQQVKEMIVKLVACWTIIKCYKMIAKTFSKQQALDADPKAIQQITFIGNLEEQSAIFFIIEEAKETVFGFSQGTLKVF